MIVFVRYLEGMVLTIGPVLQYGVMIKMEYPTIERKILNYIGSSKEDTDGTYSNFNEVSQALEFQVPSDKELARSTDTYEKTLLKVTVSQGDPPTVFKWAAIKVQYYKSKQVHDTDWQLQLQSKD